MKRINIIVFGILISLFLCFSSTAAAQYNPEVYQAQQALKAHGYNPGTPDGLWGKATERAVKYFQVDNELPVTGKIDELTKAKLGIVSTVRSVTRNQPVKERRLALVIGNSDYKSAPLKNPVNDARDMSNTLKVLGFKVIEEINADRKEMEEAIRQFGKQLRGGGVGLFYYAGHGIQAKGRNYLIPIGARIESESDARYQAVDAGMVLGKMEDAENDLNIVVLDACRDNPFSRSFRSRERGFAKMDAPKGSLIAYATAPGSVAADGKGRNGIYTKHLLKYMKTPGLTIESVLKKVRIDVMDETVDKQVPWESSSLRGDFYFNSGPSISIVKHTPSVEEPVKKRARRERPKSTVRIDNFDTKEIRYAKNLFDRGRKSEAKEIVSKLLKNSKDDNVIAEAMYCQLLLKFASDEREIFEKLRAYYPDFKWLANAEKVVSERERLEADRKRKREADRNRKAEEARKRKAEGRVWDTKTRLEWIAGPDKDTTWDEAKRWVDNLKVAGGGWRMPTMKELVALYQDGKGNRNMTLLLKTTGWFVWSGQTEGSSSAWYFLFSTGNRDWSNRSNSYNYRAFAVRSRPSAESQRTKKEIQKYASISPEVSKPTVIERDGQYIAYSNGVVLDSKTGLDWFVGLDKNTDFNDAKQRVGNLKVAGGGWRMPTMKELVALYQDGKGNRNMTLLLKTTGWFVWSGQTEGSSSAWYFLFSTGNRDWSNRSNSYNYRAFAVRSRR